MKAKKKIKQDTETDIGVYIAVGRLSPGDLFWEPQQFGMCEVVSHKGAFTTAKVLQWDKMPWEVSNPGVLTINAGKHAMVYHKACPIRREA